MTSRRLASGLGLTVVLVALMAAAWFHDRQTGIDFHTYEAASVVGLKTGWQHIYDQGAVALEQVKLVPGQRSQPFLSPPTVAWLTAPLTPLPYPWAVDLWEAVTLAGFGLALFWASGAGGLSRWVIAGAALAPWWVSHAVLLGQVVPVVAAGVVVAWRLARERRDLAAGFALAVIALKPNTAILVPFVLLVAGRYRIFLALLAAGAVILVAALITMGMGGVWAYVSQLTGPLPSGANTLTLHGALGVRGGLEAGLRGLIVVASLFVGFRLRESPGMAIAVGTLASLLVVPYIHGSDLCLLSVVGLILWEDCRQRPWRVTLFALWLAAAQFLPIVGRGPGLSRWPLVELALVTALFLTAWLRPASRKYGQV